MSFLYSSASIPGASTPVYDRRYSAIIGTVQQAAAQPMLNAKQERRVPPSFASLNPYVAPKAPETFSIPIITSAPEKAASAAPAASVLPGEILEEERPAKRLRLSEPDARRPTKNPENVLSTAGGERVAGLESRLNFAMSALERGETDCLSFDDRGLRKEFVQGFMNRLAAILKSGKLRHLRLVRFSAQVKNCQGFFDALAANSHLKSLTVDQFQGTHAGGKAFLEALGKASGLRALKWSASKLDSLALLLRTKSSLETLRVFVIGGASFHSAFGAGVLDAIRQNQRRLELLVVQSLPDAQAHQDNLVRLLQQSHTLKRVVVEQSCIRADAILGMAAGIEKSPALQELALPNCTLPDVNRCEAVLRLFHAVLGNPRILSLQLLGGPLVRPDYAEALKMMEAITQDELLQRRIPIVARALGLLSYMGHKIFVPEEIQRLLATEWMSRDDDAVFKVQEL